MRAFYWTNLPARRIRQIAVQPGVIASVAMIPVSTGVNLSGVPVALETNHTIDFAGQSAKLAGSMASSCIRERIARIEHKIYFGVLSTATPAITIKMCYISIRWDRLCGDLGLVIARPYQPSAAGPDRQIIFEQWHRKNPKDGQHGQYRHATAFFPGNRAVYRGYDQHNADDGHHEKQVDE